MTEDLWIGTGKDDLDLSDSPRKRFRNVDTGRHIGCPLSWFKLVFPIVRGKNELAVALYLYRLRSVRRSRSITVSNTTLLAELGIDRFAKYRALERLAAAGIITVKRHHKRALKIVFCDRRSPSRAPKNL